MNSRILAASAALALSLAGCGSASDPCTDPVSAAVNSTMPLPQTSQYTYWQRIEGTNVYKEYLSDHPLSAEEQRKLGIVAPDPANSSAK